jgi:hypothetical protein
MIQQPLCNKPVIYNIGIYPCDKKVEHKDRCFCVSASRKENEVKRYHNKICRKLVHSALDNFYVFEDDEIENRIEQCLIRFEGRVGFSFIGWILSDQKIRNKVLEIALKIYGEFDETQDRE